MCRGPVDPRPAFIEASDRLDRLEFSHPTRQHRVSDLSPKYAGGRYGKMIREVSSSSCGKTPAVVDLVVGRFLREEDEPPGVLLTRVPEAWSTGSGSNVWWRERPL